MEIHVAREGRQVGPFPLQEVQRMLDIGVLRSTDLAWVTGSADWVTLGTIPEVVIPSAPKLPAGEVPPPIRQSPPPMRMPAQAAYGGMQPPTSSVAIASLVLGIVSVAMFPIIASIPAVVCGHLARKEIKRSEGALGGDGIAIGGLVTGYASLVFYGLIFLILILVLVAGLVGGPLFFGRVGAQEKETESLQNARRLAMACRAYAAEHHDAFPEGLEELSPRYVKDRALFRCPMFPETGDIGFDYYGGRTLDSSSKVLLSSKGQKIDGDRVVARVDGSARMEELPKDLEAPGPR